MKDYYLILELTSNATPAEIKAAYRDKIRFYHPDRWRDDPAMYPRAEERAREINQAYQVLNDPVARADYDRLRAPVPPPAATSPQRPQAWAQPEPYDVPPPDTSAPPVRQPRPGPGRRPSDRSAFQPGSRGLLGIILMVAGVLALIGLLAGRAGAALSPAPTATPAATATSAATPMSLPTLPGLSLVRTLTPDQWCPQPDSCVGIRGVSGIAWSPQGNLLAVAASNRVVVLWNNRTQTVERILADSCPWPSGISGSWQALGWSPDGHALAAGGDGGTSGTLAIWDANTWAVRRCIDAGGVNSLTWSAGDHLVAVSGTRAEDRITTWDTESGALAFSLPAHVPGWFARWSPGGRFLAYDDGNLIAFRDVRAGTGVQPFDQPWAVSADTAPTALEWSPDGRKIAVRAGLGKLYVVSKTPETVLTQRDFATIGQMAWGPGSKQLAVTIGSGMALLDVPGGQIREQSFVSPGSSDSSPEARYVAWSPDEEYLAVVVRQGGQDTIWLWSVSL